MNTHHPLANAYPTVKASRKAFQGLEWQRPSLLKSAGEMLERTQTLVLDLPWDLSFDMYKPCYLGQIIYSQFPGGKK